MTRRYAVYTAPEPDHPLWAAGCAWLGRDPATAVDGAPPPQRQEPWRYGFHATLKAPIVLAEGRDAAAFVQAVAELAARHAPVTLPPLQVTTLDRFVALRLAEPLPALSRLADAVVMQLDDWRQAPDGAEFERRSRGLDDEQRNLLQRWGYPHVLHRWRFHLTLSDPLDEAPREAMRQAAMVHFAPALQEPWRLSTLCVFEEPGPHAPFRLLHRLPLAG